MEDEEEVSNNHKSSVQEFGGSKMEEKSLETVEVAATEQCVSVAALNDPNFVGVEAPQMDKGGDEAAILTGGTGLDSRTEAPEMPVHDSAKDEDAKNRTADTEVDVGASSLIGVQEEAKIETAKGVDEEADTVGSQSLISAALEEGGNEEVEEGNSMAEAEVLVAVPEEGGNESVEKGNSMVEAETLITAPGEGGDEAVEERDSIAEAETLIAAPGEGVDEAVEERNSIAEAETLIAVPEEGSVEVVQEGNTMVEAETMISAHEESGDEAVEERNSMEDAEMETETVKSLDDIQREDTESQEEDEKSEAEENAEVDTEMETEMDIGKGGGVNSNSVQDLDDTQLPGSESPVVAQDYDEEDLVAEDEYTTADNDVAEKRGSSGGKRKRGKNSKVSGKAPLRKTIEEDVCFICFDGGDLVLCDRRGCPKAYHPSCVNRDEAFFRAKGRWNCGWHICSNCEKNAHYMCYTCTFSLCKGCIKDAVIFCIRGNKGFCETCMRTVMLIENNQQGNKEAQVDFDDKSSWEYLFKDYWTDVKAKLSLSSDELAQAKNPWKGSDVLAGKQELPEEQNTANSERGSGSDSSENLATSNKPKKRRVKKRLRSHTKEENVPGPVVAINEEETVSPRNTEWASKELLEFVMHMKDGDNSVLSQFDVQALLLEYIKRNKLRDPRRKSQIICDSRLENLFGKPRVGHFEMLKLLESHFLIKEDSQTDDVQGTVVDTEANHLETDGNHEALVKGSKDRRRRNRKKGEEKAPQLNVNDYAAIDSHNINFIYLRRKLAEDLIKDTDRFHDKVVGTFVRIRITGSNQRQELYRLVQVIGTTKGTEQYKVGRKTTDIMLQILNLNKTEDVAVDTISNQEFTEEECKRLRQSIKCGLLNRLTVGDILEKATEIQEVRVNDWLETETVRLSHLCDRASEKGRKKELRECVEKLQLLKTSEERRRRLEEIPEVHSDPKMDPSYESEEEESETENKQQDLFQRSRGSGFNRQGREVISPQSRSFSSNERMNSSRNMESRKGESNKSYSSKGEETTVAGELFNENERSHGRDGDKQQSNNSEKSNSATISESVGRNNNLSVVRTDSFSGAASEPSQPAELAETAVKITETEKIWHYKDPSGKIQGPFSMVQLRKWNNSGYFPPDLRIWRSTETEDNSYLLTDALAGRFSKEATPVNNSTTIPTPHIVKPYATPLQNVDQSSSSGWSTPSVVGVAKLATNSWSPDSSSKRDMSNLPSPTPKQNTSGPSAGQASQQEGSVFVANSFSGQNVASQTNGQSLNSSVNHSGNKEHNGPEMLGVPTRGPGNEQVILGGSGNALPTTQSNVMGESFVAQPPVGSQGDGSGSAPKIEMVSPHTILGSQSQVFGSGLPQNVEQNSSIHVPGQPAYGQWGGGVPSTVHNPAGSNPGFSAMPPPDPWRPSVPGNQPNMQSPGPYGVVPWGMGAPGPRPDNQNTGWGPMPVNPNMGWGGPAPASAPAPANMNWGALVQGQAPMNVNPGWFPTPGNPGANVQGPAPGNMNPGWVAMPGNPGAPVPNAGWGAPTGNPGPTVQGQQMGNGNQNWNAPTGTPGATAVQGPASGNANPGWGPAGNQGPPANEQHNGGYSEQRHRGSRGGDSGFRGGRQWNNDRQQGGGSFRPPMRSHKDIVCPYNTNRRCRKGASCDYMHI